MTWSDLQKLWSADAYRQTGVRSLRGVLKHLLVSDGDVSCSDGVKYTFYLRLCTYLHRAKPRWLVIIPYFLVHRLLLHYQYKFSVSISPHTSIGSGLYLGHVMNIVVSDRAVIGKNCNIGHGVTVGGVYRGERIGTPVIGDNVYIGPGASVIGAIRVGNNVAIGTNCVVTRDVPDNAVVVGIPGRVVSFKGSAGYVNNTDY